MRVRYCYPSKTVQWTSETTVSTRNITIGPRNGGIYVHDAVVNSRDSYVMIAGSVWERS